MTTAWITRRTRNAEYLQVSQLLDELYAVKHLINLDSNFVAKQIKPELVDKAIEYLEERRVKVSPTSGKNRRSPK